MNITNLRSALHDYSAKVLGDETYRLMTFTVRQGKTPYKEKTVEFMIPDHDFVLGNKTMFTSPEAFEIQDMGREFGLRLLRAHEWRGIGFWITHDGEYHGVAKFNLEHAGHYWEGTNIPQTQDGGAYYWTGSSSKNGSHARAMRVLPNGQFDIVDRPVTEAMRVRLLVDPELLK